MGVLDWLAPPPQAQLMSDAPAVVPDWQRRLEMRESGFDPAAKNDQGYFGLYQFGTPAAADAGFYTPAQGEGKNAWRGTFNIPGYPQVRTAQDFAASPEAQRSAFGMWTNYLDGQAKRLGLDKYIGQTVNGVPVTREGLLTGMHLGGPGGVKAFLSGGGNRADANGTSVADYMQMGAGQGTDTMRGDVGQDTMAAQAPQVGGNGMAGQKRGLLDQSPEVLAGLLSQYEPDTWDRVGAIAGGIGDALIAAGSGNPNWGAAGSAGFRGGAREAQRAGQQRKQQKTLQDLSQSNPNLAALFALGGPESVGKVLAAQMMPGDPQGLMSVGGRVFDPNTKQWVTEAPAEKPPEAIQRLQALGIDPSTLSQEQKLQLGGISQPDQPELAQKLQALGIDPATLTPEQKQQLIGITPQKPEFQITQDANGNPIAVNKADPSQFQNIGAPATGPKPTDDIREYEYAKQQGFQGNFQEFIQSKKPQMFEPSFQKKAGEVQAENFGALAGELPKLAQREMQIANLGSLLQTMPQGAGTDARAWLSNVARAVGLGDGEVASKAQAFQSIVNQIVPTLRLPGSGTTSDRDLSIFLDSLPKLSNAPDANRHIAGIMSRAVGAQRQIGEIAAKAINGEISQADAQKQISEIQILTPQEREMLNGMRGATESNAEVATPPQQQFRGAPPVGSIDSGYRYKGGNPADQNSWERVD